MDEIREISQVRGGRFTKHSQNNGNVQNSTKRSLCDSSASSKLAFVRTRTPSSSSILARQEYTTYRTDKESRSKAWIAIAIVIEQSEAERGRRQTGFWSEKSRGRRRGPIDRDASTLSYVPRTQTIFTS